MKTLAFTLMIPNPGTSNGRWSGATSLHEKVRTVSDGVAQWLAGVSFYHDFGDGRTARVNVRVVDSDNKQKLHGPSDGFTDYDRLIENIIKNGRISVGAEEALQGRSSR